MEKTKVKLGEKEYILQIASTKAELRKGLMGVTNLGENEGMLFDFGEEGNHEMWMYNTPIALDQIFINSDQVVTKVATREPNDETLVGEPDTMYVVELNANSEVKEGDELEFLDDTKEYTMKVLAPDGSTQMNLKGGERIVSRRETKILIKKAKKAYNAKDTDQYENFCKSLGRYMFKVLKGQDNRDPEYVQVPDN